MSAALDRCKYLLPSGIGRKCLQLPLMDLQIKQVPVTGEERNVFVLSLALPILLLRSVHFRLIWQVPDILNRSPLLDPSLRWSQTPRVRLIVAPRYYYI